MKKYDVNVHYDAVIPVSVVAHNEEEALKLAEQKASEISLAKAEVCDISSCVTNEEEIKVKAMPPKNECLSPYKWWDDISAICNDAVNTIYDTIDKYALNNEIIFTKKYVDQMGATIERIYNEEGEYGEETYIDTETCKGSLLREEPINILMDIVDYVNWAIYGVEPR